MRLFPLFNWFRHEPAYTGWFESRIASPFERTASGVSTTYLTTRIGTNEHQLMPSILKGRTSECRPCNSVPGQAYTSGEIGVMPVLQAYRARDVRNGQLLTCISPVKEFAILKAGKISTRRLCEPSGQQWGLGAHLLSSCESLECRQNYSQ